MPETPCNTEQMICELVSRQELASERIKLLTIKQDLTVAALEKLTGVVEQMPAKLADSIHAAFGPVPAGLTREEYAEVYTAVLLDLASVEHSDETQ